VLRKKVLSFPRRASKKLERFIELRCKPVFMLSRAIGCLSVT